MWGRISKFFRRLRHRFTIRFMVPDEYKIFGVTPLTFTLGVLAQSNIRNFTVSKTKDNYVDIIIKDISRKTAIIIAKEFIFAKAMIIQDALNAGVDMNQLGMITCVINSDRVDEMTCKMFIKTADISSSSEDNLKRLCVNRGVGEEDELS